jgi:hypothetical protein
MSGPSRHFLRFCLGYRLSISGFKYFCRSRNRLPKTQNINSSRESL